MSKSKNMSNYVSIFCLGRDDNHDYNRYNLFHGNDVLAFVWKYHLSGMYCVYKQWHRMQNYSRLQKGGNNPNCYNEAVHKLNILTKPGIGVDVYV